MNSNYQFAGFLRRTITVHNFPRLTPEKESLIQNAKPKQKNQMTVLCNHALCVFTMERTPPPPARYRKSETYKQAEVYDSRLTP